MAKLRDQGSVRSTVGCDCQVIAKEHQKEEGCIQPAHLVYRGGKHQKGTKGKGKGRPF